VTEKRQYKPYGHLPRELRPHLPRMVDVLRARLPEGSPYDVIAEMFNLSRTRVQQITLSERRIITAQERNEILDSVLGRDSGGNPPA
jgi:hypothetical protein